MKQLFTLFWLLCSTALLSAQTVSISDANCAINTLELKLVGDDGFGRNVYEEDFGELRVRLAYSQGNSRWELIIIDQGVNLVTAFTNYDSSPNPPDLATAASAGAPYTDGPDLNCGITAVSGDGTQDNLGGDPCADFGGDSDNDGVCDNFDSCPGFDDLADQDEDGTPDGCDPNPATADGILLTATCLSETPILFLLNNEEDDATGRNRYSNFDYQLHVDYNSELDRWEILSHEPVSDVYFYNEFPSFPNPPDSETSAWVDTHPLCSGADGTVSGTNTQDFLGCDIFIDEALVLDASCPDAQDAEIELLVSGAADSVLYTLDGTPMDTALFEQLAAGTYEAIVQDDGFPLMGPYVCADTLSIDVFGIDQTPPDANCNATVMVSLDDTGMGTLTAAAVDLSSVDACGSVSLSLDQEAFDCDDLGELTVTLTVTDEAGYSSTCTSLVTVEDTEGYCASVPVRDLFGGAQLQALPVFPNPAHEMINVDLSGIETDADQLLNMTIFNAMGQAVETYTPSRKDLLFPVWVQDLPNGLYWLGLQVDGQARASARFIVSKK